MKNIIFKKNRNRNSKGFTLFVAMIVTSLILAIGFSIGNIILKELALSSSGKRSQIAFYAADSISECALYWDKKDAAGNPVDSSIGDSPFATSTPSDPFIQCGSGVPSATYPGGVDFSKLANNVSATSTFSALFTNPEDPSDVSCGEVTITKNQNKTVINARGYNVGYSAGGCDTNNPKTIERGVKIEY